MILLMCPFHPTAAIEWKCQQSAVLTYSFGHQFLLLPTAADSAPQQQWKNVVAAEEIEGI